MRPTNFMDYMESKGLRYGTLGAGPHALSELLGDRWSYDEAGHVIRQGELGFDHRWDFMGGRLTRTVHDSGVEVRYGYGTGHPRAQKEELGTHTEYLASRRWRYQPRSPSPWVRITLAVPGTITLGVPS